MKLKEIGEFGFIDRIKNGCLIREKNVIKAIGDDCCVFKTSSNLVTLLTTDMLVENIHFLREPMSPFKLGRKSLAVNISDIAAMGGTPREAVISIAIPDSINVEYLDSLYNGMKSIAAEFDVNLLGGDTTASPHHLVINISLVGEIAEDEILYRSGAKIGDKIFLTGPIGSSAAGLDMILSNREFDRGEELLEAHFNPIPHVRAGRQIASSKMANSMIDISDGVASDLGHICIESNLAAVIDESQMPVTGSFKDYCKKFNLDFEKLSLHVGEDYVLLGTVPAGNSDKLNTILKSSGCEFYVIGEMVSGSGIKIKGLDGNLRTIKASGYDHFRISQ